MKYHILNSADSTLIISSELSVPKVVYFGDKFSISNDDLPALSDLTSLPVPQAFLDESVELTLLPEEGRGFFGNPGLKGNASGRSWTTQFSLSNAEKIENKLKYTLIDELAKLQLITNIELHYNSNILEVRYSLKNIGSYGYSLDDLSVTFPVEKNFAEIMSFKGRWINEFQTERIDWSLGSYLKENRKGRTSHDNPPYMVIGKKGFCEEEGQLLGVHLAWSGNSKMIASVQTDGTRMIQLSELLLPGEVVLQKNEEYSTPSVYLSFSSNGLNGLSKNFHSFLRQSSSHLNFSRAERPVQFNTWEALYFDHDLDELYKLADRAMDIGVERFVLDDGWFKGRNGEKAGLGDWFVDKKKYPDGLSPLITYVNEKGMEFGIWFEPEMVNPDSDIFRANPDWILNVNGYKQPMGRYQYVLDLSNHEAFKYIFKRLDSILSEYNIGYVKWDMNRDLVQPGNYNDLPSVHNQCESFYRLIGCLNEKHPNVEFETCASGGGRVDFEVLKYTCRVWTSDCNDALERHSIQKGFNYFLPPEIMGSHFGPSPAHTTMRQSSLEFRMLTCIFAHLGFEQNVLNLSEEETSKIKYFVNIYKQIRGFISSAEFFRIDTKDPKLDVYGFTNISKDEILVMISQLSLPEFMLPEKIKIKFVDKNKYYRIQPVFLPEVHPNCMKKTVQWVDCKSVYRGEFLANLGLQLPIMNPESAILLKISVNQ